MIPKVQVDAAADAAVLAALRGASAAMQALRRWVVRIAPHAAPVLLLGPSGSGKECVAQALARLGQRRQQPFVVLNCGALAPQLVQSELFGHERGAFTGAVQAHPGAFAAADGGTLFLDEIGELSLAVQVQLLRALESGEIRRLGATGCRRVQVRLIAATHRDLSAEIRRGRFRQDLFYRLHVLPYQLPTLAQRQEDIVPLAQYFLQRQACGSPAPLPTTLAAAAAKKLCHHDWPGNVRELQHVITRAAICAAGTQIQAADIVFAAPATATPRLPTPAPLDVWQRRQQRRILLALRCHRGNRTCAARALGISRATLHRRLRELGLTSRSDSA